MYPEVSITNQQLKIFVSPKLSGPCRVKGSKKFRLFTLIDFRSFTIDSWGITVGSLPLAVDSQTFTDDSLHFTDDCPSLCSWEPNGNQLFQPSLSQFGEKAIFDC